MPNFSDLALTFQGNMYPSLIADLAESLGIPAAAFRGEDIGFYPAEQCWIIPERDGDGNIIGLLKRYLDGKKFTWPGSKRGLSYECVAVRQKDQSLSDDCPQFLRVGAAGVPCPICGRENDGCLISSEDPEDPAAVICVRTADGAERRLESGAGYLHRRHAQPGYRGGRVAVLPLSDQPVVVAEGWSDRMYAKNLGYVAIARPSAESTPKGLASLVQGRAVILMGDRDPHGAGQRGLESCFQLLKPVCSSVVKVLPPEGAGKDLRVWHPTREEFDAHIKASGIAIDDGSVLPDVAPLTLAKSWVQQTQTHNGMLLLRHVQGDYYRWRTLSYGRVDQRELRQEWYEFFTDRPVKVRTADGGVKIVTLRPDRKFMADIDDAASSYCYVKVEADTHEPFLIKTGSTMDLTRAVVFQNGILHLTTGDLSALTPDVFLTSTLPYDYRPGLQCPLWLWFVGDIFNGDQECIDLLQEWFGYNLIAANHMQSMMFFFGVPGSGKSTTAGVLRNLLGPTRCCGASTENFNNLFGKEALLNRYAAIMSESRDTDRSKIDKLLQTWKAITGGDVINVARKYKQAVDTRLFCRLTYVANEAIPFDDVSQAMAGRTNLLYFPNNYRKRNPDRFLDTKLQAETSGVALWAVEGLKRLLVNDRFTVPKASQEHLLRLADLTNPIGVMLAECTRLHIGSEYLKYRTECKVLYDLWKAWCDDTRTKTSLSAIGFGMKLAQMEHPITKKQIMEAGKRYTVYQGLEILPEAYERYLKR